MKQTLEIGGMSCGHCVGRVKAALAALPGVTIEQVAIGEAKVSFDEAVVDAATVEQAVAQSGYDVLAVRSA